MYAAYYWNLAILNNFIFIRSFWNFIITSFNLLSWGIFVFSGGSKKSLLCAQNFNGAANFAKIQRFFKPWKSAFFFGKKYREMTIIPLIFYADITVLPVVRSIKILWHSVYFLRSKHLMLFNYLVSHCLGVDIFFRKIFQKLTTFFNN